MVIQAPGGLKGEGARLWGGMYKANPRGPDDQKNGRIDTLFRMRRILDTKIIRAKPRVPSSRGKVKKLVKKE